MSGKPIVEVEGLKKSYKEVDALKGITFQVGEGEILGLLGPNGSGKSTTIGCLLALLRYQAGNIRIFGEEMRPEAYKVKEKIGIVFQDVAVFEELKVRENVDYFCGLYVTDSAKRKACVDEAIALTGLEDYEKFYPKKLSGGLLRRLNIACGIAHKPSLIILDEPTVAVDPQSREHILNGIRKLNEDGATVIYTSHYMEEVEELCDRIIILDKGKIIASGTKEELKRIIDLKEKVTVEKLVTKDGEPAGEGVIQELMKDWSKAPGVLEVKRQGKSLHVSFDGEGEGIGGLMDRLRSKGLAWERVYSELPTLNDVFLALTGTELRD